MTQPQLTWLVTGCSSGFGEAFIQRILARGDKAIATTRGSVSRISALADAGAATYSLDVTAPETEINTQVSKILEDHDVDVLVNNAGYMEAGVSEEMGIDVYREVFDTNFFGVIKVTQALLPHFRKKKAGTIVFISSPGGIGGQPGGGAYCSTKFALEGWYECLRQEIANLGIKSMIFEPGNFRTKVMHPSNVKFRGKPIEDYTYLRNFIQQFVRDLNGNQPGDTTKGVEVMIDVVRGEGVAAGKELPERLPLGNDVLAVLRKKCVDNLRICNEWEDVIRSTGVEEGK